MQRQGKKGIGWLKSPGKQEIRLLSKLEVKRSELPEAIRSSREPDKVQEQPSLDSFSESNPTAAAMVFI